MDIAISARNDHKIIPLLKMLLHFSMVKFHSAKFLFSNPKHQFILFEYADAYLCAKFGDI